MSNLAWFALIAVALGFLAEFARPAASGPCCALHGPCDPETYAIEFCPVRDR